MLFGPHQKHDILSLKEGAMFLRECINSQMKKGTLKKEFSESHLLEIREYHLRLEKFKNETVKKIDECFKQIIATLKKRKNELISEVLDKFNAERDHVMSDESTWIDKQDISERLLSLMNEHNDQNLLMNSKFIMDGIRRLNEKLDFKEIKIHNDLDTSMQIAGNMTLSLEEILHYFSKYLNVVEPNVLEYKA